MAATSNGISVKLKTNTYLESGKHTSLLQEQVSLGAEVPFTGAAERHWDSFSYTWALFRTIFWSPKWKPR